MKYINIYHADYWYSYYNIGNFKINDINSVKLSILNTKNEYDIFFNIDFYNIKGIEDIIKDDEYIEKGDINYDYFISQYELLKKGKIKYFIGSIYYPHYYRDIKNCNLDNNSIFELTSTNLKHYYCVIFTNEQNSLTPENIIKLLDYISLDLFKEKFNFEMYDYFDKNKAQELYNKDYVY